MGALATQGAKFSEAVSKLPGQIFGPLTRIFSSKSAADIATEAAKSPTIMGRIGGFFGAIFSGIGKVVSVPFGWSVKAGTATVGWVAAQPLRVARWGVSGVGGFFQHAPWLAWPATILTGVSMYSDGARSRAERRTKREVLEHMAALQPSYKDTVSPTEYAAMQARMGDGRGKEGFAAAELASRAAAEQQQASTSAKA